MFLNHILSHRLDACLFGLLAVAGCLACHRRIRRQQLPLRVWILVGTMTVVGIMLAEWIGVRQRDALVSVFSGFGPTYAYELQRLGHAQINLSTPPDDPTYLKLIETEKNWLKVNPLIADVYTFRYDEQGRVRLIVDSETDYNRNGVIDEEREQRTPIGEIYEEATPYFHRALHGEHVFDTSFVPDRWGVWASSLTPIHDSTGRVEAAVGIDYPAADWLSAIAAKRGMALGTMAVLIAILLTSATFVTLMSAEIRERKAAQARLEEARESALEASAAKSEFLAVTSHEVRTPLTAILGFAGILSDTNLDPTQRRYLETMNTAGQRLMQLLNGILDYTRIDSGKLELETLPWAPAVLIHEVLELMTAGAAQKNLTLQFENHLPGALTLEGDSTRVRQILLNLLGNAVKFTQAGGVTVRADWTSPAGGDAGRISITVSDTGSGIPPEKIPLLFQAFSQANASTTREHGGTGLGLAISRRLAIMMGGNLSLESEVGRGSKFTLSLPAPLAKVDTTPEVLPHETKPVVAVWARALVVDDQKLNRELLKVMLRRLGFESDLAASGPEAIELAARTRYAIIFTDLEMPAMDGFTTVERIRAAEPPGQRVPIVAISALTAKGTSDRCQAAGMDDYLTKPVYLPALESTLRSLVTRNGGRADQLAHASA